MRGKDGKLGFGERDTKMIIEKSHAGSHNKKNDWDYMTEAGVLERAIEKVTNKEILLAYKEIKPRKAGINKFLLKLGRRMITARIIRSEYNLIKLGKD